MTTLHPDSFPALRAAARRPEQFDQAVFAIAGGIEAGSIRNVILKDAKDTLSRAVDKGWDVAVSEPFFFAGRYEQQPEPVYKLYSSMMVMGLHDILAVSRKLTRTTLNGPAIEAMKTFSAEALPLAEAVASLRDKVIKGRAPSGAPAKPVNPNKIVKTCPCCFRQIAVVGATMAHHGYERPGTGWQTASCPGIRFRPLEISDEGLVWLVDVTRDHLHKLRTKYEARHTITSLTYGRRPLVTVTPADAEWSRQHRIYSAELESSIRQTSSYLHLIEKRLSEWKPEAEQTP